MDWWRYFNTSHVTVYRPTGSLLLLPLLNFNTSHVTVYQTAPGGNGHSKIISIHPMLRFIHYNMLFQMQLKPFQYIPCYGLSIFIKYFIIMCLEFQYIPCYGLSSIISVLISSGIDFNTSHVTVYQKRETNNRKENKISIHPMLRFIFVVSLLGFQISIFQYIPCYGLSQTIQIRL